MLRFLALLALIVVKIAALRALWHYLTRHRRVDRGQQLAQTALTDARHAVDGLRRTARDFPAHQKHLAIIELEAQLRAAQQAARAEDFEEAAQAAQQVVEGASQIHRQIILSH